MNRFVRFIKLTNDTSRKLIKPYNIEDIAREVKVPNQHFVVPPAAFFQDLETNTRKNRAPEKLNVSADDKEDLEKILEESSTIHKYSSTY